jgi:hypothetical protein
MMTGKVLEVVDYLFDAAKKIKSKYGDKVPEEVFKQLQDGDPTSKKKYLEWMLKQYVSGYERVGHLIDLVRMFSRLVRSRRVEGKEADLYSYANPDELESKTLEARKSQEIATKRKEEEAKFKLIKDTPTYYIIHPQSYWASVKYGKGTQWCTAAYPARSKCCSAAVKRIGTGKLKPGEQPRYTCTRCDKECEYARTEDAYQWDDYYLRAVNLYYITRKSDGKKWAVSVDQGTGRKTVFTETDATVSMDELKRELGVAHGKSI